MAEGTGPAWYPSPYVEEFHVDVAAYGTAAALLGLWVAYMFYGKKSWSIAGFVAKVKPVHTLLLKKYYFDEAYLWIVKEIQQRFADVCGTIEVGVLRRIIDTIADIHRWFGAQVRLLLDGHLHRYVTLALFGAVVIVAAVLVGN